jgi:hypothetical protein
MARVRDKISVATVDIEALQRALRDVTKPQGPWSARGLSLAAGGKADLVRDILRGENKNPSAETIVGLAREMKRDLAEFVKGSGQTAPAGKIRWHPWQARKHP